MNLFSTCWSSLLILMIYVTVTQSLEQTNGSISAEGYGTGGVPNENSNATQYKGARDTGFEANQTEEIPIGIPVEKEEFERMKDEAKK